MSACQGCIYHQHTHLGWYCNKFEEEVSYAPFETDCYESEFPDDEDEDEEGGDDA